VINYSAAKNGQEYSPSTYIHRVGRTGRYSDEGIAMTFVEDEVFIKVTEEEQKIKFIPMKNEQQIVDEALKCSMRNGKITEDS
jgi:superfamily II DNA/RNA helicase